MEWGALSDFLSFFLSIGVVSLSEEGVRAIVTM